MAHCYAGTALCREFVCKWLVTDFGLRTAPDVDARLNVLTERKLEQAFKELLLLYAPIRIAGDTPPWFLYVLLCGFQHHAWRRTFRSYRIETFILDTLMGTTT